MDQMANFGTTRSARIPRALRQAEPVTFTLPASPWSSTARADATTADGADAHEHV